MIAFLILNAVLALLASNASADDMALQVPVLGDVMAGAVVGALVVVVCPYISGEGC